MRYATACRPPSTQHDFVFAFHDDEEIVPRPAARIAKPTGLTPADFEFFVSLFDSAVQTLGAQPRAARDLRADFALRFARLVGCSAVGSSVVGPAADSVRRQNAVPRAGSTRRAAVSSRNLPQQVRRSRPQLRPSAPSESARHRRFGNSSLIVRRQTPDSWQPAAGK